MIIVSTNHEEFFLGGLLNILFFGTHTHSNEWSSDFWDTAKVEYHILEPALHSDRILKLLS